MARVTADGEKHKIYKKTNKIGKGKPGDIMVNHPTTNKGKWDTINLTKKAGAKTVKQGVAATKKWHRENPYPKMAKGGSTPAWTRKEGKSPSGGLNAKGVASYKKANPGSKLKTAVTTKPSKLKPGSEAAGRRKRFCSRMEGMKKKLTSTKTAKDPNSRINKSLRKWNC
jgi:hypothetical protein